MGRLIDADELLTHIEDFGEGQYRLDLIDPYYVRNVPTVEAIPKADYETRLKADMVAMLTDIQLEMESLRFGQPPRKYVVDECLDIIQQKINSLNAESEDNNVT